MEWDGNEEEEEEEEERKTGGGLIATGPNSDSELRSRNKSNRASIQPALIQMGKSNSRKSTAQTHFITLLI